MHELLSKAILEATPPAAVNKLLNLDPSSAALLPVRQLANHTWMSVVATSRSAMPSQFRRFAVPAAEASETTGLPHAFIAQSLLTYRSKKGLSDRHYKAPLILTPVHLNADETYSEIGAPMVNEELRDFLKMSGVVICQTDIVSDPNATILEIDRSFRAVFILNLDSRKLKRFLEAAANGLALPAFQRLLGVADRPFSGAGFNHLEIRSRALDIDQRAAFDAASQGLDLVIFGPPGCGKSDLLCAIARAALDSGKQVLICSTVAAAIDVARRRLAATDHTPSSNLALETVETFANTTPLDRVFDLVLIDEATRMTVSEGLVVSSRARQLIVCGDPQQMRPATDRQSVYDQALKIGLPVYRLRQHYRSRHPHLVEFSNFFLYGMRLRTERTPNLSARDGIDLIVIHKPEIQRRAEGSVNFSEADIVARRLRQHVMTRDPRSIGVIAVTRAQVDAIKRRTTELFSADGLDISALNSVEPFFVRTTDAVQGEERDVVLVSVTLGPVQGRFDQKFGPLSRGDPLKRLNVMLSRARSRCEIITSIVPDMIDQRGRSKPAGAALFLVLQMFNALLTTEIALDPDPFAEELLQRYRRPGDALDNLGIVTGWRLPGGGDYALGVVGRSDRLPPEMWDATISHLRAIGWTIVEYDESTFDPNNPELISQIQAIRQRSVSNAIRK